MSRTYKATPPSLPDLISALPLLYKLYTSIHISLFSTISCSQVSAIPKKSNFSSFAYMRSSSIFILDSKLCALVKKHFILCLPLAISDLLPFLMLLDFGLSLFFITAGLGLT